VPVQVLVQVPVLVPSAWCRCLLPIAYCRRCSWPLSDRT